VAAACQPHVIYKIHEDAKNIKKRRKKEKEKKDDYNIANDHTLQNVAYTTKPDTCKEMECRQDESRAIR